MCPLLDPTTTFWMTLETDSNAMSVSAMTRNVVGQMGQLILSTLQTQRTKTTGKRGLNMIPFITYSFDFPTKFNLELPHFLPKLPCLSLSPFEIGTRLTKQMHEQNQHWHEMLSVKWFFTRSRLTSFIFQSLSLQVPQTRFLLRTNDQAGCLRSRWVIWAFNDF